MEREKTQERDARRLSLRWWQEIPATTVPLETLQEDRALQPRVIEVIPFRDRGVYRTRSGELVAELRATLQANPQTQLTPLLVAEVKGARYVVDGHHRLQAYRRAGRTTVPVRCAVLTWAEAITFSKMANCGQATLPVHNEQKREAVWQWLAMVTDQGANPYLPNGVSLRDVEGYFGGGASRGTIQNMMQRIAHVQPDEYSAEAKDPATGWPRWKYVRNPKGGYGMGTPEQQQARRKEKAKERAGKFLRDLFGTLGAAGVAEVFAELRAEWGDRDLDEVASEVAGLVARQEQLERLAASQAAADTAADEF